MRINGEYVILLHIIFKSRGKNSCEESLCVLSILSTCCTSLKKRVIVQWMKSTFRSSRLSTLHLYPVCLWFTDLHSATSVWLALFYGYGEKKFSFSNHWGHKVIWYMIRFASSSGCLACSYRSTSLFSPFPSLFSRFPSFFHFSHFSQYIELLP